jgi:hypothetical protein
MDETTFWQMIEQAKTDSGGDTDKQAQLLIDRLSKLDEADILGFDALFDAYHSLTLKRYLHQAGSIAYGRSLRTEHFSYFRAWLIAQGRQVYTTILLDPDALADVVQVIDDPDDGKYANVLAANMDAMGISAFKKKTGHLKIDYSKYPEINIAELAYVRDHKRDESEEYPRLKALFGNRDLGEPSDDYE